MTNKPTWDFIWMSLAAQLAKRSGCKRAHVGAVIASHDNHRVLAIGYNGGGRGMENTCGSDEPGNCGCFPENVKVQTSEGTKRIQDIKVGDLVLTHNNRYRKVTKTLSKPSAQRDYIVMKLAAGKRFISTVEHPLLVKDGDDVVWRKAENILPGDIILHASKKCDNCDTLVPKFRKFCIPCFHASSKTQDWRKKISKRMRENNPAKKLYGDRQILDEKSAKKLSANQKKGQKKLTKDLFARAKELETRGNRRAIVADHGVCRPDIILIDWDTKKVAAYEFERSKNRANLNKYENNKQYDEVIWSFENGSYTETYEVYNGFCCIPVKKVERLRRDGKIYNLEVEEDNSYMCQNVIVHNCLHAEENACLKNDYSDTVKKKIYTTYSPCLMCAKRIVNSSIDEVIYLKQYRLTDGIEYLKSAGIVVRQYDGESIEE